MFTFTFLLTLENQDEETVTVCVAGHLDTFPALANEVEDYEIADMAGWLRSLADAIDAA